MLRPCDVLATCLGCTLPHAHCQLGSALAPTMIGGLDKGRTELVSKYIIRLLQHYMS